MAQIILLLVLTLTLSGVLVLQLAHELHLSTVCQGAGPLGGTLECFFHLGFAEPFHAFLSLLLDFFRRETSLSLSFHHGESLDSLLLLRLHSFLGFDTESLLSFFHLLLLHLLGDDSEPLSSLDPLLFLLLDLLQDLHGGSSLPTSTLPVLAEPSHP